MTSFKKFIKLYRRTLLILFYTLISIFTFFAILLFTLPHFLDLEDYKKIILNEIESKTELKIDFKYSELRILPNPGIKFDYVSVMDQDEKVADVNGIFVGISLFPILSGSIEIDRLHIQSGSILVHRTKDGNFSIIPQNKTTEISKTTSNTNTIKGLSALLNLFPSKLILENVNITYNNELQNKIFNFYVWKAKLNIESESRNFHFDLFGKMNEEKLEIYSDFSFVKDELTYNSLRIRSTIFLTNFSASIAEDILIIFPDASFNFSSLTSKMFLSKDDDDLIKLELFDVRIQNLSFKNQKSFGNFTGEVTIQYSYNLHKLSFDKIRIEWQNYSKVFGNGYLTFGNSPLIYFNIGSYYLDVDSTIQVIKLWLNPDLEKSPILKGIPSTGYKDKVKMIFDWNLKKIKIKTESLASITGKAIYHRKQLHLSGIRIPFYSGEILSDGQVIYDGKNYMLFTNNILNGVQIEPLINKYFQTKYITGNLGAEFILSAKGKNLDLMEKNIIIIGNYNLKNGELFGYFNFLRPIATFGKFITFKGSSADSMSYSTIKGNFKYENKNIYFSDLKMKGTGIDANGEGKISRDQNINMRLTVSLPGAAGKAIKLPIIYRGIFGKNFPIIDPVWLGSVYVGTIIFAGPAGAAVGGIAGSAVSEYVENAISSVRDGFSKTKNFFFNNSNDDENPSED
jgi:hypothetical protein